MLRPTLLVLGLAALPLVPASAQEPPRAAQEGTVCPEPARLPPADSPPLYRCVELRAHPTNETFVDPETYQNHLRAEWSLPSQDKWVAWDEQKIQDDFWNLWNTGFLDDLWVEVLDEPYANGVGGKHVIFHLEERSRVKVVDYVGSERVSIGAIEDAMSEREIRINLDSFVDQTVIRQIRSVIRELYADKGYHDVNIETELRELPGGPKLTHLVFEITEGPKYQIREIVFDGNQVFADGKLRRQLRENRQPGLFSIFTGAGTYRETKFADDAEALERFYLKNGYVRARVGLPQVETIEDSEDGSERAVRLRIPVDEGLRYRVGKLSITGNKSLAGDALLTLFKIQPGDWFDREKLDKGVEEVQKIYSQLGFYKIGVLPDFQFPGEAGDPATAGATDAQVPGADPVVDITLEMVEGERFFVNRITFTGNSTTHDAVIRREMRIQEGGPFNTAGLQESIRRLNQLGYFQPFEGTNDEVEVTEVPGQTNLVDVTMRVVEQNRNQITFGAGVSQYDGFFGQLSYQTANFLGRGEVLAVSMQKGAYADNYQVSFSEPYMFDRPITIGADVFKRTFSYPFQFSQDSTGGNLVLGLPASDYSRVFIGYSFQAVRVYDINEAFLNPNVLAFNPLLVDSLLLNVDGHRTVSKISPSWVFNTVNQPIFPSAGTRYTVAADYAGLGGNTSYLQGRLEGTWYRSLSRRMSVGMRAQARYIRPWGDTTILPIFEKYFLGGEYDIRGFDLRSISPRDARTGLFTGGNKSLVFNAEYAVDIASPVRVLAFFDAGQVQDVGDPFRWKDPIEVTRQPGVIVPVLSDPFRFSTSTLTPTFIRPVEPEIVSVGETASFKVSTGFELRFFMPVVNVPFRLIAAYNPSRGRIFTNNGLLTPKFTFRFAVGTTF
ncbi:MAG TPA: outer membrane protein assembly factor BamA [Vicinamibacterales bacterium]|nr:outer membrane protein assembly factor BamA [Vicinamibacterales bacterium]